MINTKIIKIASFTNNVGLKNKFTHRSSLKIHYVEILLKQSLLQINLNQIYEI